MSRPFIAIVPRAIVEGDKILLKGTVKEDAYEFSINFAVGTDPNPSDIVYHFKTIIPDNTIVENYKRNGEWMDEQVKDWPSSDGRLSIRIPYKYSDYPYDANSESNSTLLGPGFALEFAFTNDSIYTYLVEDESRNLISYYDNEIDMNEINSVQVWGDVEKIQEITFRYS